jgi:hypothetical protein
MKEKEEYLRKQRQPQDKKSPVVQKKEILEKKADLMKMREKMLTNKPGVDVKDMSYEEKKNYIQDKALEGSSVMEKIL